MLRLRHKFHEQFLLRRLAYFFKLELALLKKARFYFFKFIRAHVVNARLVDDGVHGALALCGKLESKIHVAQSAEAAETFKFENPFRRVCPIEQAVIDDE